MIEEQERDYILQLEVVEKLKIQAQCKRPGCQICYGRGWESINTVIIDGKVNLKLMICRYGDLGRNEVKQLHGAFDIKNKEMYDLLKDSFKFLSDEFQKFNKTFIALADLIEATKRRTFWGGIGFVISKIHSKFTSKKVEGPHGKS